MWEKFTSSSKRVIKYAHEEAKHFRNDAVDTEHLLLGLLKDENSFAVKALVQMDVNIEKVRSAVIQEIPIGNYDFENLNFSKQSKEVLELAYKEARQLRHTFIGSEHLLLGLLKVNEAKACEILNNHGVTYQTARKTIIGMIQQTPPTKKARSKTPTLDEFGIDLNKLAEDGKLDPVVGRTQEIKRLIQILSKRTKNNPVLIGEPGVGKTAIVEGLAQLIINDKVPGTLKKARMVSLDLAGLVAGTKFRGEFEDRLKRVMKEITTADPEEPIILFIDELHTVIGAGAAEGAIDASNILKPALSRGELRCIGATTNNEYKKYIARNGALERRFQPVNVEEPTVDEAIDILYGLKSRYEEHHGVEITDESIRAAAHYSQRFITSRSLPDKAIDLLDEACSKVAIFRNLEAIERELAKVPAGVTAGTESVLEVPTRVEVPEDEHEIEQEHLEPAEETPETGEVESDTETVRPQVTEEDIAQVVHAWTGIPVAAIAEEETLRLLKAEEILAKRVKGQEKAIETLSRALRRARVGLKDPKRPTGSFLFTGPTGVGKTELAKALAEFLFGDEKALIRFDMSEYMERHSVSRLVGAPPGYVGYDEGGQLTEAVKRRPYSVILMDEIEKAHYEVFNILLQIMEDGVVTDSHGRHVDLKNTIIILTSNLGTDSVGVDEPLGFRTKSIDDMTTDQIYKQMEPKVKEALKRAFRPEFLNRLDEIILFRALTEKDIIEIADKFLDRVAESARDHELTLEYTEELKHYLARKGFSKAQGARPLRRVIQKDIEDPLSEQILKSEYLPGMTVKIDVEGEGDDQKIVFKSSATIALEEPATPALPSGSDEAET